MNKKVVCFSLLNALLIALLASVITNKTIKKTYHKKTKIVGIISDYQVDESKPENLRHLYDFFRLKNRWVASFTKACGTEKISFVVLPISPEQIDNFANLVDGVVFTGGQDIDAKYFGQEKHPTTDEDSIKRTEFELAFAKKIMEKKKPTLGICRGMQMLNVVNGGDIIQDIPSFIKTDIIHSGGIVEKIRHSVDIEENSLLYKILKTKKIDVNSAHHQAIGNIGNNLKITATSPDGINEAIELKDADFFYLGVQWHPEALTTDDDVKIIQAFCEAVENN